MLKSYFLIALRNLNRQKLHSFIKIAGLAVGMGLTILLLSFIKYELSYEDFNPKKDRIYRSVSNVNVSESKSLSVPMTVGHAYSWVTNEVPEVKSVLRLDSRGGGIKYENKIYDNAYHGFYSDSTFFDFFDLKLKYGSKAQALKPNTIVLTEKLAMVIFKRENPIGKTVNLQGKKLEVAAVIDELPSNTHLDMDYLVPVSLIPNPYEHFDERGMSTYVYYLFKKGANTPGNVAKLSNFIQKKVDDKNKKAGWTIKHRLQNLSDIHLHSEGLQYTMSQTGNMRTIIVLSVLAFFIVLIAIINYVNLETARAETRSMEVGVRKANGANKKSLIFQFLSESLVTVLFSFILAVGFAELISGGFENLVNREFSHELYSPLNVLLYFALAFLVSLLAGFYPAVYLSGYSPLAIFKSRKVAGKSNNRLRITLVITQFSIATFLIISLVMIYKQIQYTQTKDLGFDKEQVLIITNLTDKMESKYTLIRNKLANVQSVKKVTASTGFPGAIGMHSLVLQKGNEGGVLMKDNRVKNGYNETLGLEMKSGRYFSDAFRNDSNACVINEQAAKMLGLEKPVGKFIKHKEKQKRIIGVMKDYHVESLKEEIMPVIHTKEFPFLSYIVVRLEANNIKRSIRTIKRQMENIDLNYVFRYRFLDEHFEKLYKEEKRVNKITVYSAAIAIFIALLGLYALTSFVVIKRRKEIGIRKAMGASVKSIIYKLIKDINKWVLIANLIAWPFVFYFMRSWLENFAYRIDMDLFYFIAGTLLTFIIALTVVGIQAYLAAIENPSETLKDE